MLYKIKKKINIVFISSGIIGPELSTELSNDVLYKMLNIHAIQPLEIIKVERKEAGDDLEKYKIKGFPSILLIDEQDNTKEFDGDRTVSGLEKFVSGY